MKSNPVLILLIAITSFTSALTTDVGVGKDGNLAVTLSEQKAEAKKPPRPPVKPPTPTKKRDPRNSFINGAKATYRGLEVVNNVVDGYGFIKSLGGGEIFFAPDELPIEWHQAATACDKVNGKLTWRNNLKTCVPR